MTRSLPVVMAMLLLGACASAPVDESAAPFTEGVYYFDTSEVSPHSTAVSHDCETGNCVVSRSSRLARRVSGSLILAEDGSISLGRPTRSCTQPSPRSWHEEEIRFITFLCGDLRITLRSSDGTALYTVERKSTVRGRCARYSVDSRGRRTNNCEAYHTRTVTSRETIQLNLVVIRVDAE